LWTKPSGGIRNDMIQINDSGNAIDVNGVALFTDGNAFLTLRSESKNKNLVDLSVERTLPGQSGLDLALFDARFEVPATLASSDKPNPDLPANGEILSVGFMNEEPRFVRLGCFEFCNDESDTPICSGPRPVDCPM
jgi:hypothetical protein